ncbi:MAG: hypothetical protein SV375_16165 [Thermodesulfobacteriota bacterium]|nr:hypothetical protein [Thermodesulfobacteriota bacterium]
MSSILKALKRLENQQPQKDDGQSQTRKIDTKKAMNKRAKGTWLFNRVLSLSFLFIFLVVGGWFIFNNKTRLIKMFSPEDTPPESHNHEAGIPSIPIKNVQRVPPATSTPVKALNPASIPEKQPPPLIHIEKQKSPAMEHRELPLKKQPESQEKIDESRFKLEAIIWSNNPESRFAVINGCIVKVGGSVEGVSVTHIDRDYVSIQS